MKNLAWSFLFLCLARLASGAIINVEFKFTPFLGDPAKDENVTCVPGKAAIFINNVPFGEQEVRQEQLPVLPEDREISPAIDVPMSSVGPVVRKGKNKIRIEFTPNDSSKSYCARLRWEELTDEVPDQSEPGAAPAPTEPKGGVDDRKEVKGKVVFERDFTTDFAFDLPWHHYPPVTSLTEDDKQKMVALLQTRANWFKPDFAELYQAIEDNGSLKVDDVRKAKCLEAAYQAGLRVPAPQAGDLEFVTTGGPEVVIRRAKGTLFGLDEKSLAPVKDEEVQMCAGMVLSVLFPGRLAAVRKPDGAWEIVY